MVLRDYDNRQHHTSSFGVIGDADVDVGPANGKDHGGHLQRCLQSQGSRYWRKYCIEKIRLEAEDDDVPSLLIDQ